MKNCTLLWGEAHFEVKSVKTRQLRSTFSSCDVEKCTLLWREAYFEVKSIIPSRDPKQCGEAKGDETSGGDDNDDDTRMRADI